jgi:hypothetical protein
MHSAELRIVENAVARKLIVKVGHSNEWKYIEYQVPRNIVEPSFDSSLYS